MRRYKEIPERKRLEYIFIVPRCKRERPEEPQHSKSCSCRKCRKYERMLFKIRALNVWNDGKEHQ